MVLAEPKTARLAVAHLAIAAVMGAGAAWAQPAQITPDTPPPPAAPATGFWQQQTVLGDLGGARTALAKAGITLSLTEASEVFGNTAGGLRQGVAYDGLTTLTLQMDTGKVLDWNGGTLNLSVLNIHGRNFSQDYLANAQTISSIAAADTTRIWELWFQQDFPAQGLDVRVGQQSADQEFLTSPNASLFLNSAMGWPLIAAAGLYAGGPAYPLSSLGVRLRAQFGQHLKILAGVYDDNPPGGPFDDDGQRRGGSRFGANLGLDTGALMFGEIQAGIGNASYKLGFYYDTGSFPDQHFGADGLSLADPRSVGVPRLLAHNFAAYGMIDATLWTASAASDRTLSAFGRVMAAPGDRNLFAYSFNGGLVLRDPWFDRKSDSLALGIGVGKVSSAAIALDRDAARIAGSTPLRSAETFLELTCQIQATPWLQVQPDAQYIFMPGGGLPDPGRPRLRIGNEATFGGRLNVTF